jgi:hypothetical protein
MKNTINDKTSPNQMRIFMKRIREGKYVPQMKGTTKHELSMRDMLKITRKLNEDIEGQEGAEGQQNIETNKKTVYDQGEEEEKFRNYFDDMNVDVKFTELKVYDNLIFWGGTIDGVIQFTYTVTPDSKTSKTNYKYLPDFTADNPDNDKILEKIESYFDIFYKYWRNNVLQA